MNQTIQKPQSSWLPEGGENVFQRVKQQKKVALDEGVDLIDLTVGEPEGSAVSTARTAASDAILRTDAAMHTYMDNGEAAVPEFCRDFVRYHVRYPSILNELATLPLPGIKSMFPLLLVACGAGYNHGQPHKQLKVVTTTNPGYPTPAYWAKMWGCEVIEPPIAESGFKLIPEMVPGDADVVFVNYPHNPSGQGLTYEDWRALCGHCERNGIRLVNDGAYAGLAHTSKLWTLTDVASEFQNLSWIELFSSSKLIGNGTGWRVAVAAGSSDFIGDLTRIKGNADSGGFAPAFAGVLAAVRQDDPGIKQVRRKYHRRMHALIETLTASGMQLAIEPKAGFFTFWQVPKRAFGREINGDGEAFAKTLITETGVAGIPNGRFIRFALCTADGDRIDEIGDAFKEAEISY